MATQNFVGGKCASSAEGEAKAILNPATGEVLGTEIKHVMVSPS